MRRERSQGHSQVRSFSDIRLRGSFAEKRRQSLVRTETVFRRHLVTPPLDVSSDQYRVIEVQKRRNLGFTLAIGRQASARRAVRGRAAHMVHVGMCYADGQFLA